MNRIRRITLTEEQARRGADRLAGFRTNDAEPDQAQEAIDEARRLLNDVAIRLQVAQDLIDRGPDSIYYHKGD